jgi:type IV secretion system protein TrbL
MFLAWALVLLAFFILAIQLFVTLIEFKLTTLSGFVLIPFGLFGKSAFMAERVLGNVISSGIKVLVLAVIIGIGSTLFSEFTAGFGGATPSIDEAMAIVLAALSLLGLGIFGPGIASGIVSGGPQLSAGAAVGTGLPAGGMVALGVGAAAPGGAPLVGGAAAAARGGAALAGGASTAYSLGTAGQSGAAGVASGLGGVARAGGSAAISPLRRAASRAADSMRSNFNAGGRAALEATGGSSTGGTIGGDAAEAASSSRADAPPAWAQRMRRHQKMTHAVQATAHAVRSGDANGGGSSVNLSESDR